MSYGVVIDLPASGEFEPRGLVVPRTEIFV
jgi:hypothetical protein